MARKRTERRPAPKPEPEKPAPKPTALTIKGDLVWRAWVERGAEHCRTDVAKLVDAALVAYLRSQGFDEPPPKR